jgi:hypothetical protein
MKAPTNPIIQLHPADNVAVVIHSLAQGDILTVNGASVCVERPLGIGHKVALRQIAEGEAIVKYGITIGRATGPIAMGMHVHTHNIASNYTPTYTLD